MAAVHRELAAEAGNPDSVPSLRALQRAVRQDLSAGERAGLKGGEAARRRYDVYGKRPQTHRNACWEGDHKRIPVRVNLEGSAVCPWVTWFIDVATKAIVGVAVTPHQPARDAVLAALRTGISMQDPYGPFGGLPGVVRVDRGKEFLCRTVERALGAFAVPVHDLPAYKPYRKGTIEALNGAVEEMLLVSLPGYTHRARPAEAYHPDGVEDLLSYPDFVKVLLDWVSWWNTEHHPAGLDASLTPLAAWEADPVPVEDVAEERLAFFAMEDDGRVRKITTNGISWRRRAYIAPWMAGHVGMRVRLRYLPHFDGTRCVHRRSGRPPGGAASALRALRLGGAQPLRTLGSPRKVGNSGTDRVPPDAGVTGEGCDGHDPHDHVPCFLSARGTARPRVCASFLSESPREAPSVAGRVPMLGWAAPGVYRERWRLR
ncbi:Mu transposase C-terminal domain-containing protein [Streptomyces xanthophaeus]|uniref:Mu transposase C-terminal domain-containing protein n=1 Tax=Streptomyces xanthophaeus TaxID=67385 RepID=UPI00233E58D8|nr:Mu transposase C-terminal domain-containing protein [Streptomyces xanthophaeus]